MASLLDGDGCCVDIMLGLSPEAPGCCTPRLSKPAAGAGVLLNPNEIESWYPFPGSGIAELKCRLIVPRGGSTLSDDWLSRGWAFGQMMHRNLTTVGDHG